MMGLKLASTWHEDDMDSLEWYSIINQTLQMPMMTSTTRNCLWQLDPGEDSILVTEMPAGWKAQPLPEGVISNTYRLVKASAIKRV